MERMPESAVMAWACGADCAPPFAPIRSMRLHGVYYITKQIIPALGRALFLVGADLNAWFNELPRVNRSIDVDGDGASAARPAAPVALSGARARAAAFMTSRDPDPRLPVSTIDRFYPSSHCRLCDALTHGGVYELMRRRGSHAACADDDGGRDGKVRSRQAAVLCEACLGSPAVTTFRVLQRLATAEQHLVRLVQVVCVGGARVL